jgi:hypothetical protein
VVGCRTSIAAGVVALALAAGAPAAHARDPGRWVLTGWSSVPTEYWQGITSDPAGNLWFDGVNEGLYRTAPSLRRTATNPAAIPATVKAAEGYNHIGDISWDAAEGGRVLLPLECYTAGAGNTCGTGSIGVADPATLAFRYYVKLDPAEIAKAMWVETSPDGQLVWTSSRFDLLAYRTSDISPANAAPAAPPVRASALIAGAVPPSGVTGGAFLDGRLFLAGQEPARPFQVWSVDVATGARRLEIELPVAGESEGLQAMRLLGGRLHWLIAPLAIQGRPTFGPDSAVLHFVRAAGRPVLRVGVRARRAPPRRARVSVLVTKRGRAVPGAMLRFAGHRVRTDRHGRARIRVRFARPGRFRVLARRGRLSGHSRFIRVRAAGGARGARLGPGH